MECTGRYVQLDFAIARIVGIFIWTSWLQPYCDWEIFRWEKYSLFSCCWEKVIENSSLSLSPSPSLSSCLFSLFSSYHFFFRTVVLTATTIHARFHISPPLHGQFSKLSVACEPPTCSSFAVNAWDKKGVREEKRRLTAKEGEGGIRGVRLHARNYYPRAGKTRPDRRVLICKGQFRGYPRRKRATTGREREGIDAKGENWRGLSPGKVEPPT